MARDNFEPCLEQAFKHEGGYVDHPNDPGGATNYGITHLTLARERGVSSVTKTQVKNLSKLEAGKIYRRSYWDPVRGDDLPHGIDLVVFDGGINSGPRRGAQWMQRALGVPDDGKVGNQTITAAKAADPVAAIQKACAIRMGFLRGLRTWGTFGRGWSRRVASVEAVGVSMAVRAAGQKARPVLIEAKAKAQAAAKKDQAGAAGAGAGGGGSLTIPDIPDWGVAVLIVAAVVVAVQFLGRKRHEQDRAAAYQLAAEEAKA